MKKNILDYIALVLIIIGALNWGLIGLFNFNLVQSIFGSVPVLVRVIYGIVGLSGLYGVYYLVKE